VTSDPWVEQVARYEMSDNEVFDLWRLRADAHLTLAEGRAEEAVVAFEAVLARPDFAALVDVPERAIDHVGAARALLLLRRTDDAATHADEARRLLERWGGWRRAALATLERRLGRGDEMVTGPPELTPREREVVALLADGLTNAEVAERLYISPRTAGVHVSNILAKLGMSSRTEVAAWAVRAGLETS
jgi:DNA-binding NarL/FixJ family response regulator